MADGLPERRNTLLIPLLAVSAICVVEAVVIAFLAGRGSSPSTPAARGAASPAPATHAPAPDPSPSTAPPDSGSAVPAIVRGKVGERVVSGGLALTVMGVTNVPRYKEVTAPPATQKFVGVDVVIENNSSQAHQYFSTSFKIKDPKDRVYASGGLGVGDPPLEWGTVVQGEKVRGHVAFVVPKEASGLTLVYMPAGGGPANYRPIHIDLGQ